MDFEVEEAQLVGPAPGLIQHQSAQRGKKRLTPDQKVRLINWANSVEYDLFLTLSEELIEEQETAHFKNWKDKEAFERTGLIAVAMRIFFERLQTRINAEVDEFSGEVEFAKVKQQVLQESPEEMIQREFK